MVKQARTKLPAKDDKQNGFPNVQITYMERVSDKAKLAEMYGTHCNPPTNTACLLICVNGDEGNKYVIPLSAQTRPINLKENEFVTGNFKVGSIILFDADGNITITGKNNLTANIATKTTINCPEIILGQSSLEYIVKATKLKTWIVQKINQIYNNHTHPVPAEAKSVNPLGVTPISAPTQQMSDPTEADLASQKHKVGE